MSRHLPQFTESQLLLALEKHYQLSGSLKVLDGYLDQNLLLTTDSGTQFVVKVANSAEPIPSLLMQNLAMARLMRQGLPVPHALKVRGSRDDFFVLKDDGGNEFVLRVLSFLTGQFYAEAEKHCMPLWQSLGQLLGRIDTELAEFDHPGAHRELEWDLALGAPMVERSLPLLGEADLALLQPILDCYHRDVAPKLKSLPQQVIHNDANDFNLLVDDPQIPVAITGLIDFGDMVYSHRINELAIACAYAIMKQDNPLKVICAVTSAYHRQLPLEAEELEVLLPLIQLRLCTSIANAHWEAKAQPDNEYLSVSVAPARASLSQLAHLNGADALEQLRLACHLPRRVGRDLEQIVQFRQSHLSKNLSVSYQQPLKIVRGRGAYLFDEQGKAYLDMVNNVCHVGHCHPHVVAAGQAQMAQLNTNTRYLHDNIIGYAEKLLATFPEPLSVLMLVNSGSEANELAFRLARAYTGSEQLLVVDGAYHGNTSGCIDASSYKFDGPGGEGAKPHVMKVALPDPFRGPHKGMGRDCGGQYAQDVARAVAELTEQGLKPGAFICESLQGVAGQIIMPEGYLEQAYQSVREAGGVCIADEVQVGFGRVGTHMWAFETQNVVPDIVTLGKPIGNGHPMAAVVTTPEIAKAFETGMEYFNTFGGNPVSCAIGTAVLEVIEQEQLMAHAHKVGQQLQQGFKDLANRFQCIGDVRGLGLFIGVELVEDRDSLLPATQLTGELVERLKQKHQILLSTEGKYYNVLKIKPPMAFSSEDAERVLAAVAQELTELC
ncbi:aminotransferase class III-fold pyridoxal phosphate-dependent enzyme [Ferrimonas aestuarii]|uniref:Aminotransferase class III-fold pyridoxal phosphate-dependent enzyme n=1 Tax=Ferrimonas aestuarii TaxID=2569539 RepID=A0A4U1BSR1_9GAMM|nr:aminotransferase class III-fold pyridoxal phosphate-dependent enzyme [Ferrimonas aestuarii]TKB58703.1 aminotransferase class III-fold pyridoxal phosphate-dependent enzyme [Ferrimonas aestuarii]